MAVLEMNLDQLALRGDFTAKFLSQYKSSNTRRSYEKAIKSFFNVDDTAKVTLHMVQHIYAIQVQDYIKSLSNLSASTVKQRISALSSFVDYINYLGRSCGVHIDNPFNDKFLRKGINKEESAPVEQQILSEEEIATLLSTIKTENQRDYVLFKTMFNTGLRREEVVSLSPLDIIEEDGEYYLSITGKGRKTRFIWISESLCHMLLDVRANDEIIFNMTSDNVYKLLKKYLAKANINKSISPHSIRHTAITHTILKGATITEAQEFAGHSSIQTTRGYFHNVDKLKNCASRKLNF